jgi:hypothetical protein
MQVHAYQIGGLMGQWTSIKVWVTKGSTVVVIRLPTTTRAEHNAPRRLLHGTSLHSDKVPILGTYNRSAFPPSGWPERLGLYRFTLSPPSLTYHVFSPPPLLRSSRIIQVTNLANTSCLIYHSLLAYPTFGDGPSSVNWCGKKLSPLFDLDSWHTPPPYGRAQVPRGPRVAKWKKKSDPEFPKITYTSFRILYRLFIISDSKDLYQPRRSFQRFLLQPEPDAPRSILRQTCLSIH